MKTNKMLILVVEDNPDNRKVIGNLLMHNEYYVGFAVDGEKALEFIKKRMPDLILMDVMLPGLDGFEVCEKLKENCSTRHIPIIFLTALTETDDIIKGFKAGGVDYISKPFNSEELLARVNTHIELLSLRGLLPICANCKRIREDNGYWECMESYIESHSNATFSHGLCSECTALLYGDKDWYKKKIRKQDDADETKIDKSE